jgi:choline dehydrogenase-like flavoprotein
VLAQRLARHGWRVVILEAGPFWHPDEDWVSDEAGSHPLYWTQKRIIGGADPIELGKNNSGRGVGGSMVHYAGYTPRFHPAICPPIPMTAWARTGRSSTKTCARTTSR